MERHGIPAIDRLLARKADIEQKISNELKRPLPDTVALQSLKRKKLSLKDRVTQMMRKRPFEIMPVAVRIS